LESHWSEIRKAERVLGPGYSSQATRRESKKLDVAIEGCEPSINPCPATSSMLFAWLLSLSVIGATVVIHSVGLGALMRLLNARAIESEGSRHALSTVMAATVVAIAALHGCEAAVWAVVYRLIGVVPDFETAFYFSFVAFTTLGLGDVTLKPPWRILSAMEAADGMLLFGWSTAFLFAVVQRVWRFGYESDRSLRDVHRKAER
jgi:hypothetical protein